MLRITVHDKPGVLTFQLEGRLAGPWVRVLQECCQSALARRRHPIFRVDLTGVTSIDVAGQACLAALHGQGAEFAAADCLMKAVVAEITRDELGNSALPDRSIPASEAEPRDNSAAIQRPLAARRRRERPGNGAGGGNGVTR